MKAWRRQRLSDQIGQLVTVTCAVAIFVVSGALALANHNNLRAAAFSALDVQTDIAAMNSGAPLVFGDRDNAVEVLGSFRAMPSVSAATLYDLHGRAFARYRRDGTHHDADIAPIVAPGLHERAGSVISVATVQEAGLPLGHLQVVYDLTELDHDLWRNLLVVSGVSLLVLLLVAAIARQLARIATRPLAQLTHTAQRVSDSRDYSLRADVPPADDEIGKFTATFNEMLAQIEGQDRDLKDSRAQAEEASRLKDEFLATLSHELRTPMTPILGWAQILRRIEHEDPRIHQGAEIIERNALAQTRIVDDLLDMSRIVAGKVLLQPEPVRVDHAMNAALDAVRVAADAREIRIDVQVPADLPFVIADPHRLQQVFWNLLSNAIKFTPRGGSVQVRAAQRDDAMRVTVQDDGEGIEPAFLPHVFDRFRQADSSITRRHEGLGLGLAIVKHLVELHGGSVAVHSDGHERGTLFTVNLPLRRVAGPTPAPTRDVAGDAPRAQPLRAMKLLVVENDDDARQWLQHVLADHGADVRSARSAREALSLIADAPPDVLVSDIGMPGLDGYDFLRALRALPEARGGAVPAIAVTAFARPEDRARAMDAGYQRHLGKPIDEHALVAAILSLLPA